MRQLKSFGFCLVVLLGTSCGEDVKTRKDALIQLTPTTLDFGEVDVGTPVPQSVTVTNSGQATLEVSSIFFEQEASAPYAADLTSVTLEPDEGVIVEVTFNPSATGTHFGELVFISNASNWPRIVLEVTGRGGISCDPCTAPTGPTCKDADTSTTEYGTGTCLAGVCQYSSQETACDSGCEDGSGICANCTPACPDPCGGFDGCGGVCPNTCAPLCDDDDLSAIADKGFMMVPEGTDIVPLCNGVVLLGNSAENRVVEVDIKSKSVTKQYDALGSYPRDLELDAFNKLLWVAKSGMSVARIDLETGEQTTITLTGSPANLAIGNDGRVFATVTTVGNLEIHVIDGINSDVEKVIQGDFEGMVAYDRIGDQLFTGARGDDVFITLGTTLVRHVFDPVAVTLDFVERRQNVGRNGSDLGVSPDGASVVYPALNGNDSSYEIFDFSTDDLTMVHGEWSVGSEISSASFSPIGDYLGTTDGAGLIIFDTQTHERLVREQYSPESCFETDIFRVRWSQGGHLLFGLSSCPMTSGSNLYWMKY